MSGTRNGPVALGLVAMLMAAGFQASPAAAKHRQSKRVARVKSEARCQNVGVVAPDVPGTTGVLSFTFGVGVLAIPIPVTITGLGTSLPPSGFTTVIVPVGAHSTNLPPDPTMGTLEFFDIVDGLLTARLRASGPTFVLDVEIVGIPFTFTPATPPAPGRLICGNNAPATTTGGGVTVTGGALIVTSG